MTVTQNIFFAAQKILTSATWTKENTQISTSSVHDMFKVHQVDYHKQTLPFSTYFPVLYTCPRIYKQFHTFLVLINHSFTNLFHKHKTVSPALSRWFFVITFLFLGFQHGNCCYFLIQLFRMCCYFNDTMSFITNEIGFITLFSCLSIESRSLMLFWLTRVVWRRLLRLSEVKWSKTGLQTLSVV